MQQASEGIPSRWSERSLRWVLLLFLMLAAMVIYYPRARHNLPVAMNVDDRTALSVLLRFHQGSANPNFFMYPTLYFYLTYVLTAMFGFGRILLTGHLLNLSLVGVTAWLSYIFCVRQFTSRGAGIVAAACVLFSPLLISSGAYLCTDVLLAAMTLLSVDRMITYFKTRTSRDWLLAMVAIGCAIATKYTAAILYVTYFLVEVVQTYRRRHGSLAASLEAPTGCFSLTAVSIALLSISLLCALLAIFFPVSTILHFVTTHRTNSDRRSLQDYLSFLDHLRRLAVELSIGAAVLLAAVRWSRTAYECVALKRLYFGVLILFGIFVVTTPYSILDPGKFVYDIGALLRANVVVAGTQQQWGPYWHWLFDNENRAAVLLGIAGLGLMAWRATWQFLSATLYLALYLLTICSSHLGVARYLDPALPLLYCGTGLMFMELWRGLPQSAALRLNPLWWRVAVGLLCAVVLFQLVRTAKRNDAAASEHDAFYASYYEVLHEANRTKPLSSPADADPGTVLYAGYAPSVELGLAGVRTQPVSWTALEGRPLGQAMSCSDLLILNVRQAQLNHISAEYDDSVHLLLDDPRGLGGSAGQIVARRKDCQ